VRRVGFVKVGGRLKTVWAGFRVPISKIEHNYTVFRLLAAARVHEVRSGSLVDPRFEFDAELYISGELAFALEFDNGQERYGQVFRQMSRRADSPVDVLWVVTSEARLRRFIELGQQLSPDGFLFALLDETLADFHGPIWRDPTGRKHALERVPEHEGWLAAICQPQSRGY
jgi:hypothetical protein